MTARLSYLSLTFLALLLPALAGCAVDQDQEVALYRDVLQGHAPATTQPAGQTIEAADTLSLSAALALASRDNERVALAGEDYLQALIDKDRAFAEFLPTISFNPNFTKMEAFNLPPGVPANFVPQHPGDIPFNVQANVFNGFRDVARLKAAGLTAVQQQELFLNLHASLLLEVAQTYYAVLKAERSVVVLSNSLAVQENHVQDVADKLAQGVARQLDLEQAKAQAAATRVRLTDARNAVAKGRTTLATLVGVPAVEGQLTDEYSTPRSIAAVAALLAQAHKDRHDLAAADQAVLAARQQVDAAFNQYYPSISLNLETWAYRETFPQDSLATAMIEARVPIFSAGRIHADVRTAWSRFRQTVLARALLARQVTEQVRIAVDDFTSSQQRTSDLAIQVAAAQQAFRIASDSYDQGLATSLDRLDAQDRLLSAQLQLAAEHYDTTVYYLNVLRAVGQLDGPVVTPPPTTQPDAPPVALRGQE